MTNFSKANQDVTSLLNYGQFMLEYQITGGD